MNQSINQSIGQNTFIQRNMSQANRINYWSDDTLHTDVTTMSFTE